MDGSALVDLAETLREPLEGPDPCGHDTRYDPEHVSIRAEVDKLDPVAGGGGSVDWVAVCEGSLALLRGRSKDLSLASYLLVGMAVTRGLAGLTPVVRGMVALIREHWSMLHPRGRERRKVAPIEWALGRVGAHFEGGARGASATEVEAASASLRELESALVGASGVRVGALGDLLRAMAGWTIAPPAAPLIDAAVDEVEVPTERGATAAERGGAEVSGEPAAPSSSDVSTVEVRSAEVSLAAVMTSLRTLARKIRGDDPSRALAYRLTRLGIWLEVEVPLPTRNGRTLAMPIDPRTRALLERAESASQWQEVVALAESACLRAPLALDLQRMCHRALVALGPRFGEASRVVGEETLRLVALDRGILNALARDGSALADDATRGWIASLTPARAPAVASSLEVDGEPETGDAEALLERVEARLAGSASGRGRAEMRLWAATRLGSMGQHGAAVRVLAPLMVEIERRGLLAWDPDFCASVAEVLIRSARQAPTVEVARALEFASDVLWMVKPLAGVRLQPG